jgi:hypothetical protein
MNLSSYQRLLRYCGGDKTLTDNATNRQQLMSWLPSVSDAVEHWLNRGIQIQTSFTEYFNVNFHTKEFYPKYIPVVSIDSIYVDSLGMWDGRESLLSSVTYHPGLNGNSIVLVFARPFETNKGLRAIYTGGMAADGVQSIYVTTQTGAFTVGKFIYGGSSNAIGILRATDGTNMTIEVLYGRYSIGETVYQWDTEDGAGGSTSTATLNSATSLCIAEAYPEITRGVELQIRYMWKNKDRFEQATINKDGASTRRWRGQYADEAQMQPEVTMILAHLRRMAI